MTMDKRLVLFDLDGVLLDSRQNMALAWAAVQLHCGVSVPFEDYFALIGRPFAAILAQLGLEARVAEIEPVFKAASLNYMDETPFFGGAPETLQALKAGGLKLGLVTSKDEARTLAVCSRLPAGLFDTIETPSARCRGKPAPDHLLLAMAETGTDPADTLYIGDMDSDCEAARRAGVDYLHAKWGYGAPPVGVPVLLELLALPHVLGVSRRAA